MIETLAKTVMVVEDEPAIRSMLSLFLESQDYDVVTATDGQDALDKVRAHPPDAILLDLMLPHVDGYEVIRTLDAGREAIPIIAFTASNVQPGIVGGNVRACLTKPCSTDVILRTLEDVLSEGWPRH